MKNQSRKKTLITERDVFIQYNSGWEAYINAGDKINSVVLSLNRLKFSAANGVKITQISKKKKRHQKTPFDKENWVRVKFSPKDFSENNEKGIITQFAELGWFWKSYNDARNKIFIKQGNKKIVLSKLTREKRSIVTRVVRYQYSNGHMKAMIESGKRDIDSVAKSLRRKFKKYIIRRDSEEKRRGKIKKIYQDHEMGMKDSVVIIFSKKFFPENDEKKLKEFFICNGWDDDDVRPLSISSRKIKDFYRVETSKKQLHYFHDSFLNEWVFYFKGFSNNHSKRNNMCMRLKGKLKGHHGREIPSIKSIKELSKDDAVLIIFSLSPGMNKEQQRKKSCFFLTEKLKLENNPIEARGEFKLKFHWTITTVCDNSESNIDNGFSDISAEINENNRKSSSYLSYRNSSPGLLPIYSLEKVSNNETDLMSKKNTRDNNHTNAKETSIFAETSKKIDSAGRIESGNSKKKNNNRDLNLNLTQKETGKQIDLELNYHQVAVPKASSFERTANLYADNKNVSNAIMLSTPREVGNNNKRDNYKKIKVEKPSDSESSTPYQEHFGFKFQVNINLLRQETLRPSIEVVDLIGTEKKYDFSSISPINRNEFIDTMNSFINGKLKSKKYEKTVEIPISTIKKDFAENEPSKAGSERNNFVFKKSTLKIYKKTVYHSVIDPIDYQNESNRSYIYVELNVAEKELIYVRFNPKDHPQKNAELISLQALDGVISGRQLVAELNEIVRQVGYQKVIFFDVAEINGVCQKLLRVLLSDGNENDIQGRFLDSAGYYLEQGAEIAEFSKRKINSFPYLSLQGILHSQSKGEFRRAGLTFRNMKLKYYISSVFGDKYQDFNLFLHDFIKDHFFWSTNLYPPLGSSYTVKLQLSGIHPDMEISQFVSTLYRFTKESIGIILSEESKNIYWDSFSEFFIRFFYSPFMVDNTKYVDYELKPFGRALWEVEKIFPDDLMKIKKIRKDTQSLDGVSRSNGRNKIRLASSAKENSSQYRPVSMTEVKKNATKRWSKDKIYICDTMNSIIVNSVVQYFSVQRKKSNESTFNKVKTDQIQFPKPPCKKRKLNGHKNNRVVGGKKNNDFNYHLRPSHLNRDCSQDEIQRANYADTMNCDQVLMSVKAGNDFTASLVPDLIDHDQQKKTSRVSNFSIFSSPMTRRDNFQSCLNQTTSPRNNNQRHSKLNNCSMYSKYDNNVVYNVYVKVLTVEYQQNTPHRYRHGSVIKLHLQGSVINLQGYGGMASMVRVNDINNNIITGDIMNIERCQSDNHDNCATINNQMDDNDLRSQVYSRGQPRRIGDNIMSLPTSNQDNQPSI